VLNHTNRATIRNHPNFAQNQYMIQESALQYRTVTPSGEPGYERVIPNMVKTALEENKLNHKDDYLVQDISGRMTALYQAKYKEAFDVKKNGKTDSLAAHKYAMGEVRYTLGLDTKDGEKRKSTDVEKTLSLPQEHTSLLDESDRATRNRAEFLATILNDKANSVPKLTEEAYWIPSLGPNSLAFKQLLAYAEGKPGSSIPAIYHWIAGYMPNHNYEQLAAWQLAQVGKTLPSSSAAQEAMKITEPLAGFFRAIGYKTNSTDIQQAKINAKDGQTFTIGPPTVNIDNDPKAQKIMDQNPKMKDSGYVLQKGSKPGTYTFVKEDDVIEVTGTPTTFETTSLSFDEKGNPVWAPIEDNPMYMGNNLEGWLEKYGPAGDEAEDAGDATADISELEQVNFESDRLNTIYNEKGFHDEDPGPEPSLKNYPLQPGDEATRVIVNGIPTLAPYNEKAWQEDVNAWKEKKSLYRPLTKIETTGGRAKSRYTTYFNPETDTYEKQDVQDRLFPEEKDRRTGREKMSAFRQQKFLDARLERAAAQPDSKVVNVHRTDDGRYIQGPITVYKHVDRNGKVQYKLKPPGSESLLQSFWNIPGSPVLSPALQGYAMELYNSNLQTA